MSRSIPLRDVGAYNETFTGDMLPEGFFEQYTFRRFAHLCDDAPAVLRVSDHDVKELMDDARVARQMGTAVHPDRIEDWACAPAIERYLKEHADTGVFAKIADASPKDGTNLDAQRHDMRPLRTLHDLWRAFALSRRVQTFLRTQTGPVDLVLRPWDARITPYCEWRVFVHEGACVGASQQHLYRAIDAPDANAVRAAITAWLAAHALPWPSAVLDVFVADGRAHLIEANPWCRQSGSGLFRWAELLEHRGGDWEVRWVG